MAYADLFAMLEQTDGPRNKSGLRRELLGKDGYNANQVNAVLASPEESVLVHAGAGTGKTRVLTSRVQHLLELGVSPEDMLICTFTRNAADEVRHRLPGWRNKLKSLGTIHSLALRGRPRTNYLPLRLAEPEEAQAVLEGLRHLFPDRKTHVRDVLLALDRMRENRVHDSGFAPVLAAYKASLAEQELVDYTQLIEDGLMAEPSRKYKYVLVDEVQDVTRLQAEWLASVAAPGARLYCVGDENQAIYGFRGATSAAISRPTKTVSLLHNYRSAPRILEFAAELLGLENLLIPTTRDEGRVEILEHPDEMAEMAAIADTRQNSGELMVLARTNALLAPLQHAGIPAMTIHAAKGREWDSVWVIGLEEGNFPQRRGDPEEEKRLAYVAATRARKHLRLSWCHSRSTGLRDFKLERSSLLPA